MEPSPFPVISIACIQPRPPTERWLVEDLWGWPAVGFVAGSPKSYKTWLSCEVAAAVASGQPCLGRYPVHKQGRVLIYAAEDSAEAIHDRIASITSARQIDLDSLGIGLIAVPSLRLDDEEHRRRLRATVAAIKPRLLILDPLVRLHSGDENSSADVSSLLAFLRTLQREFEVAILVVHHVRKSPASQPGQALRGSGDLHAWLDSGLYLLRSKGRLMLHPEHRDNPVMEPIEIALDSDQPHLIVKGAAHQDRKVATVQRGQQDLEARVVATLAAQPLTRTALREQLRVRNETLGLALGRLQDRGIVAQIDGSWAVVGQ